MYIVYAIKSQKDKSIYVGFSKDLNRRIIEHNNGRVKSTKSKVPYKLIYKEEASTRPEARKKEKYLKSGCGKEFLKTT